MSDTQFKLSKGIEVADVSGIAEGYSESKTEAGFHHFVINVSADNIAAYFLKLIS